MRNIDETELARLEALAGKASLLPWANTDTAKELLNVEPDDWWKIYASNGPEEAIFPYHVVCSMSQRATDEEMAAARKAYFYPDGDHVMRDPGKSGDNARYIASACNAVPALVAEVRRLREDRAAMLRDMDAVKTKAEPCDDCWTIYMLMREMGIEEKNWFHRDVCARLTAMQNAEKENASLREKVEAWEWLDEVRAYNLDVDHPYQAHKYANPFKENRAKAFANASFEWIEMLYAAREAVHADRE